MTVVVLILVALLSGAIGWTCFDFFGNHGVLLAVPATCLLSYGAVDLFEESKR